MEQTKAPNIIVLILLVSFGVVSAVLFTPALPDLARFFSISQAETELTVSMFLAGYALGQLPYGALSNRFGRKPALYIAVLSAGAGACLCIIVTFRQ